MIVGDSRADKGTAPCEPVAQCGKLAVNEHTSGSPGGHRHMAVSTRVDLLQNRRTKIIATLGPACSDAAMIRSLVSAGVNLFRMNMSHGDHDSHRRAFEQVREVAAQLDVPVAVLADLCGPKIRTGAFPGGSIFLTDGSRVTVSTVATEGSDSVIVSRYEALADDVVPGDVILLADGLLELKVLETAAGEATCEVVHGGTLGSNKGINLPGVRVSAPSLTDKDRADAAFALALGVDYIALSFVREAGDIQSLRALIAGAGSTARIIAKIEKPEALSNADGILDAADAIMIARGDLGVELPPEQVPRAQAQLVELAREAGKPVIVATQMLESMIEHSRPTRAEVTDVSHAVNSQVDAVMLSAETAAGAFPLEAVRMMDRIARQTEAQLWEAGVYGRINRPQAEALPLWTVIAATAARMSRELRARAVMVVTRSGKSAEIVATARPEAPIVAITHDPAVCRRLCLHWGVLPRLDTAVGSVNPNELARQLALDLGLARAGQHVLLVRGFHGEQDKNLPSVTVIEV